MSVWITQNGPFVPPSQVWSDLTPECQARVIQFLARLASNAQLEVSMAAFDQVAAQARQLDRQWQLTLERARYEAELARRRFVAVEPENRLVARTLEREWNEKLADIERMERDATLRPRLASRLVDPAEQRRMLALARDLSKVWHSPTTPQTARKQVLGYLIKDVTLYRGDTTIQVAIRWQTGVEKTCIAYRARTVHGERILSPRGAGLALGCATRASGEGRDRILTFLFGSGAGPAVAGGAGADCVCSRRVQKANDRQKAPTSRGKKWRGCLAARCERRSISPLADSVAPSERASVRYRQRGPADRERVAAGEHHVHCPSVRAHPLRRERTGLAGADVPVVRVIGRRPWTPGLGRVIASESPLEPWAPRVAALRQDLIPKVSELSLPRARRTIVSGGANWMSVITVLRA